MSINSKSEIEISELPQSRNGSMYMKRPKDGGTMFLRIYPYKTADGKLKLGRPTVCHWIERKKHECTGKGCQHCESGVELTTKVELSCVDRKASPNRLQILEVPPTVFEALTDAIKQNTVDILGDKGTTFSLTYSPSSSPAKKYVLSLYLKDKKVLNFGDKLLPFEQAAKPQAPTPDTAKDAVMGTTAQNEVVTVPDGDPEGDTDDVADLLNF